MLGRKVVKGQQFFSVFLEADSGFRILRLIGLDAEKAFELFIDALVSARQIACNACFAFAWADLCG